MRKMMLSTALILVAVLVLSVIATAQPGGGRGGFGPGGGAGGFGPGGGAGGIGMLLRNEDVKAQLGLSEDQIQKLEKIFEEGRANRPQRPQGQGGPPSAEEMERMRADAERRRQESQNKIRQVLSPEQQEKVKVLGFQISGGLSSPMVSADSLEVLNLTPDQKAKLRAIEDERGAAMRANFANMPGRDAPEEERRKFFEEARAKGEELRRTTEAKIQALLTDEQKAKAAKLTEEGREIREKVQQQIRSRGDGSQGRGPQGGGGDAASGEGGGGYRPGSNSWQPGQGAGNQQQGDGNRRSNRGFPRAPQNQQ